jgi:deoxyribonuclease (pyrimidine dimer)
MNGHILFFKDKGLYIRKRYDALREEMVARGFRPTHPTIDTTVWPEGFFNDWEPTAADLEVIRARIKFKLDMKPEWYRYKGKHILKET